MFEKNILHNIDTLYEGPDKLKMLCITWNMARKDQFPDFRDLILDPEQYDVIVLSFQESHNRQKFIEKLDLHMGQHKFKKLNQVYMWEMFMIGYHKEANTNLLSSKVTTHYKACGMAKTLGNKGGIQMYFKYNGYLFNFIGCHLVHGPERAK